LTLEGSNFIILYSIYLVFSKKLIVKLFQSVHIGQVSL